MTMTKDVRQEFIEYCKQRIGHHNSLLLTAKKNSNITFFCESIPFIQQRISAYYDVIDDIEYDIAVDAQKCCGEQNDCCTKS